MMKRITATTGAELSSAELQDHPGGDVSAFIWPTYKRLTAAAGGDVQADFQFSADDTTLETWFYDYLGREFTERYQGKACFLGRVHTMRLAYNRLVMTVSLDWLYNSVACQYTSALDNATLMTGFFEDAASIAAWGRRAYIIRPTDVLGLSEAQAEAQRILAEFAQPRVSRGNLERKLARGQLKVTVQGMSQTLDAEFHNEPLEGEAEASAEVLAALSGASFITAGGIAANPALVSTQAEYRRKLERIAWIAGRRDSLGRAYNYGAVGSRRFDYQPVGAMLEQGFRYSIWVKRPFLLHFSNNSYVPAPLVRPGGYSQIVDMRPANSSLSLEHNPLNQFDATVEYSAEGALLRGGAWGPQERAAAIQMALIGQRSH